MVSRPTIYTTLPSTPRVMYASPLASPHPSPRHVSFGNPTYSRLPHDDEAYVLSAFARHASHCPHCRSPRAALRSGRTLCAKGHARAADLLQYLYLGRERVVHSVVDRRRGERVQIELGRAVEELVVDLLTACQAGLSIVSNVSPQVPDEERSPRHAAVRREGRRKAVPAPRDVYAEAAAGARHRTAAPTSRSRSNVAVAGTDAGYSYSNIDAGYGYAAYDAPYEVPYDMEYDKGYELGYQYAQPRGLPKAAPIAYPSPTSRRHIEQYYAAAPWPAQPVIYQASPVGRTSYVYPR